MLLVLLLICLTPLCARAASDRYLLRGIVRDSLSRQAIPFASVSVGGNSTGTIADSRGIFEVTVPNTLSDITVSSQGYTPKKVSIRKNRVNMYEVLLCPSVTELDEVVVTKRKYSKRNNPAVDMMQRIRRLAKANDPRENDWFNYRKYERITIAINNFNTEKGNAMLRAFPFLAEHVDTSEVSGNPILPLMVKEKDSEVHWRRDGHREREIVHGLKSEGIDRITDVESMRAFLNDVLREIDVYDHDINLLQNRFVSPLSPISADFYKFYITDTVEIDSAKCIALSFYPHNKSAFGFIGQMYVEPSDTAMFIRRITMRVPSEINLNFIQSLYVDQEFARAPDGSRIKTHDDLILEVQVLPGTPGIYARRNVAFADHNFRRPEASDSIFSLMGSVSVEREAKKRDDIYWQAARLIELPPNEGRVGMLMQRLRSKKLYYYGEKLVKMMSSGYIATGDDSRFDIGPLNTMISGNTLEGLRLRLGGMTTANLSPHWFSRFYGAYGFRDHKWKYGVELEYSFREKEMHSREFPMNSVRLTSRFDDNQLGQHYLFTNPDNLFLALKRTSNDMVTYERFNELRYILELENNFSVEAAVVNRRNITSRLMSFSLSDGQPLWSFDESWGEIKLRYAPDEKFYQTRSYRFPINMDAPVLTLTHRYGPGDKSWSRWGVNRTELSIQKRFWFSAWGYLDLMAAGGHVWSRNTAFTQLFVPNANLSYTIQPESFALLNTMEFVTDSYASWFVTYYANGAILNYIPLVKKLKLREVFSCNGYWGTLSSRNRTSGVPGALALPDARAGRDALRHTPYVEVSAGIENILKCLRVDYVWRITHRNPGYDISRGGVRVALHFTF